MATTSIVFYSYKGGVGRSLTLANMAGFLSQFGFRVGLIDLDLEAPGLHYKFDAVDDVAQVPQGVTRFLANLSRGVLEKEQLARSLVNVSADGGDGSISLLPAGDATKPSYWDDLASVRWDSLFGAAAEVGPAAMSYLVETARAHSDADFLLIDSRTGITVSAGVATSLLADVLVVFFLPSREHIDGTVAIIREAAIGDGRLKKIVPVISRAKVAASSEEDLIESLHRTLCDGLADHQSAKISRPVIVHADDDLASREFLIFGRSPRVDPTPRRALLNDYVRLFASLVPEPFSGPQLEKIRQAVRARLLDDPVDVARTLESLAAVADTPEVVEDLVKFYSVTRDPASLANACSRLYTLHGRVLVSDEITHAILSRLSTVRQRATSDPLDVDYVSSYLASVPSPTDEFAQNALAYIALNSSPDEIDTHLERLLPTVASPSDLVANVVRRLAMGLSSQERAAARIASQYMELFSTDVGFLEAASTAAGYVMDIELLTRIVESEAFPYLDEDDQFAVHLRVGNVSTAARLLGRLDDLEAERALETLHNLPAERIAELRSYLMDHSPALADRLGALDHRPRFAQRRMISSNPVRNS